MQQLDKKLVAGEKTSAAQKICRRPPLAPELTTGLPSQDALLAGKPSEETEIPNAQLNFFFHKRD